MSPLRMKKQEQEPVPRTAYAQKDGYAFMYIAVVLLSLFSVPILIFTNLISLFPEGSEKLVIMWTAILSMLAIIVSTIAAYVKLKDDGAGRMLIVLIGVSSVLLMASLMASFAHDVKRAEEAQSHSQSVLQEAEQAGYSDLEKKKIAHENHNENKYPTLYTDVKDNEYPTLYTAVKDGEEYIVVVDVTDETVEEHGSGIFTAYHKE